ncbi:MAG TPA: cupredoxin family copper-binding protein [Terriglobales bacterium]|nr:cupredoxin family copper-binding protein [Terriglobales bacterium]
MKTTLAFKLSATGLALAVIVLAACQTAPAGSKEAAAAKYTVEIDNYSFTPQSITVPAGATVTWTNADDVPHTVAASDMAFHSKAMDTDEQYSHTFDQPGTYKYFCTVHPRMTGTVVVEKK